ncbi:hypothetical protein NQ317_001350 [Molorchus minor]|uniref:DNA-directed RNA polymerase RpoA/D/Rpb3-type domain-containing protein n=1 Tax=Molorchus minor TaxID=1323400 RepID=A0ABQ9JPV9_9CUCU|nr:hypothetical protein NQ317_001350 [Molorchus minor]
MKLIAVKSCGKDHAKFSPVATAFYRLLPDIKLVNEVEGEAAYRLQQCFSPGVIGIRQEKNGKKLAVVNNARYDTGSRNVFRHDDLKDAVIMSKIQDHFIFTIESVGAMQPADIFKEAVKILRNKCVQWLLHKGLMTVLPCNLDSRTLAVNSACYLKTKQNVNSCDRTLLSVTIIIDGTLLLWSHSPDVTVA